MVIDSKLHRDFFNTEISTIIRKDDQLKSKRISDLINEKKLFIGRLVEYDDVNGYFTFRLNKKYPTPRQFTEYFLGLIGDKAWSFDTNPVNWTFTYKEFRKSDKTNNFWNQRLGGNIQTERFYKEDSDRSYFQIIISDTVLANKFKSIIDQNPWVLITEPDPPLKYLQNLRDFVIQNPNNTITGLPVDYDLKNWRPNLIDNTDSIASKIGDWSSSEELIIIQGPPGTGKSYNAALFCNDMLKANKSVCICALANKALMEISAQDGLQNALLENRVWKTNLSDYEKKELPNLQDYDGGLPAQGELLLSSYYKLSMIAMELLQNNNRYDVLIIEEASQAFLATIALFKSIAKKVILIGDHMQLPPVINTNISKLVKIHEGIMGVVNGMATLASAYEKQSFRLTKTRRLTNAAASQTGLFYEGTLGSISELNNTDLHMGKYQTLFDENGGSTILELPVAHPDYSIEYVKKLIIWAVSSIIELGDFSISVLAQTRVLETDLTKSLVNVISDANDITISTVHKIQGITVDYSILYLPLKDPINELGENFFNVATSRAKRGTLIITYDQLKMFAGKAPALQTFLNQAKSIDFKNISLQ